MKVIKKAKKVIKFIKEGKINLFYYNKCLEKQIDEKAIILCSQQGKDINGNIFYIAKELNKEKYNEYKKYILVEKKYYKEFKNKFETYGINNLEYVIFNTKKFFYVLATSKYLFNDTSFLPYFIKREEQVYFNTWHGTPYKNMGKSIKDDYHSIGNVQRNFIFSNYLLYPSKYMRDLMIEDYMLENITTKNTKSLMFGYPRNSIFLDENRRKELKEELNLNGKQIISYMPTWRGSFHDLENDFQDQIDIIENYLKQIDDELNDNQVMFVNLHPFLKGKIKLDNYKRIKPFDKKYETYDFLNMSDILITDYSSVFFDFAVTRRKIILFAYDEEEYFKNRGTYFDFKELPFKKVKTVDDLIKEINNKKTDNIEKFIDKFCKYECNNASEKICDLVLNNNKSNLILEEIPNNKKENVLLYAGNFSKNGITSSLLALLKHIDLDKKNYYLTFIGASAAQNKQVLKELDSRINYFPITSNFVGTFKETLAQILYKCNIISYEKADKYLSKFYEKEIKRCYGNAIFNSAIQYTGYGDRIIRLFSKMKCKKSIYVHSDMLKEAKTRKNQKIETLTNAYKEYDNVIVVNEELIETTKKITNEANIINIDNIIDYQGVREKAQKKIKFDDITESNISLDKIQEIMSSNSKKIISIGRFSKEKGYDRLIDSFNNSNSNSYLIIIGGFGPLYEELCEKVNKLNNDRIVLIKYMSNPFPILKKCDIMIISSYYEGLPMVLFEAAILNIPIISTDIPSIKSFFEKYNGGKIVENSNKGLDEAFKTIGNEKVKELDINFEKHNNKIVELFEKNI